MSTFSFFLSSSKENLLNLYFPLTASLSFSPWTAKLLEWVVFIFYLQFPFSYCLFNSFRLSIWLHSILKVLLLRLQMKAVSLTAKILASLLTVFFLSQPTSHLVPKLFGSNFKVYRIWLPIFRMVGFPDGAHGKKPVYQCWRDVNYPGSIPGSVRSPGAGHGNLHQ